MEKNYGMEPRISFSLKSVVGLLVIFLIWQGGSLLAVLMLNALIPATRSGLPSLISIYLTFLFLWLGIFVVTKYFYKISFKAFLLEGKKLNLPMFLIYFSLYLLGLILYLLVDLLVHPQSFILSFAPLPWFGTLIVIAPLILLQSCAEEILFRGYIYRMFRPLKAGVFGAIFCTSMLFTLIHGFNAEIQGNGIWGPAYYLIMALFLGFVAYQTNGLVAPVAIHFAVNIFNTSIWTYKSSTLEGMGLQSILYRNNLDMRFATIGIFGIIALYIIFQIFVRKRDRS